MAESKLTFTADDKDVQKAYDNMVKATAKIKEELRKLKEESKKGAQEAKSGSDSQLASLGRAAAGFATVGSAVAMVRSEYASWRSEVDKLAQSHKELQKSIVSELAKSGDLKYAPKLEKAFGNVYGSTVAQVRQSFAGVSAEAVTMSPAQRMAIASEVSRHAATGVDLGDLGRTAGQIADLMPGASAGDILDVTTAMRDKAGGDLSKMGGDSAMRAMKQLMASGAVSKEKALGYGLAAFDANLKPGVLQQVAQSVAMTTEEFDAAHTGKLSAADAERRKFTELPAAERLRLLHEDKNVGRSQLGDAAFQFQQLDRSLIDKRAAELSQAQSENYADKQLAALKDSAAGRAALDIQHKTVVTELQNRTKAEVEFNRSQLDAGTDAMTAGTGVLGSIAGRAIKTTRHIGEFFGDVTGGPQLPAGLGPLVDQANQAANDPEFKKLLGEQNDLLRTNNELLKDQNRRRPVNVDKHNE